MNYSTIVPQYNNVQNFVRRKGDTCQKERPFVASKAILQGYFVAVNSAGLWDIATPSSKIISKLSQTIATTDNDFATAGKIRSVMAPVERDVEFDFKTSVAFSRADIGKIVDLDATAGELNTASVGKQFEIVEYYTPIRGRARLLAY